MKASRSGFSSLPCSHRIPRVSASFWTGQPRIVLARVEASGPASAPKPLKFFYFDPSDPETVVEVVARTPEPAKKISAPVSASSNGHSYNGNGHGYFNGNSLLNGNGSLNGNGNGSALATVGNKEMAQVQALSAQLELARTNLLKLQQYEMLYKEARMRTKQAAAEMGHLQTLVAEKDAELARQYKRMELEAAERSQLRSQFTTANEEVKALRAELDEHRQAMIEMRGTTLLNKGRINGNGAGSLSGMVSGNSSDFGSSGNTSSGNNSSHSRYGHEVACAATATATHTAIQDSGVDMMNGLQGLAKSLTEGLEQDLGYLFGMGKLKI